MSKKKIAPTPAPAQGAIPLSDITVMERPVGTDTMSVPRIGRPDLLARVLGKPAPPRTAGEVAIRARELARCLAHLTHLVPLVGRRIHRDATRRARLDAIQDQAIALCEELARLAEDVARGAPR